MIRTLLLGVMLPAVLACSPATGAPTSARGDGDDSGDLLAMAGREGALTDAPGPAGSHGGPGERLPPGTSTPEAIGGPGFSGRKPQGQHWKVNVGRTYLAFTMDTPAAVAMAARGQTFVLMVRLANPAFALDVPAGRFPQAFEAETRRTTRDRFRLISVAAAHRGTPGEYCADYQTAMEERDDPAIPGVVLETRTRGFACLDESSAFVVQAFYSERRPRGTPTMVDASLREEAEAFLKSLIVNPKRER